MGIVAFLLLGLLAGVVAKMLMPGPDPGGILVTMAIGVVGALIGGFLAAVLFDAESVGEDFDPSIWLTTIIGAMLLLALYRMVPGSRRRRV